MPRCWRRRRATGVSVTIEKVFLVYMMASRRNGTLYIGVTGNPVGRISQHQNDWFEGFTKRYGVKLLVWYEFQIDVEVAIRREKQIKEWQRAWKVRLIEAENPEWRDLFPKLSEGLWQ